MIYQVNKENGNRIIKKERKWGETRALCHGLFYTEIYAKQLFRLGKIYWELGTSPSSLNVKIISIVN